MACVHKRFFTSTLLCGGHPFIAILVFSSVTFICHKFKIKRTAAVIGTNLVLYMFVRKEKRTPNCDLTSVCNRCSVVANS